MRPIALSAQTRRAGYHRPACDSFTAFPLGLFRDAEAAGINLRALQPVGIVDI